MKSLIVLYIFCWFLSCSTKLKYYLHMAQQLGYINNKYISWLEKNKNKVHTNKDKIYVVLSLLILILYLLLPTNYKEKTNYYALTFLILSITFFAVNFKKKYESKKPLEFTQRAKRLYAMTLSIVIADFLISLGIVFVLSKDILFYFPIWAAILSLMYYFSPYYLIAGIYLVRPIEKNINNKYYDQASNKLRQLGKLTSVGITGSYGKTSTKFITSTILKEKYRVLSTPESYNTPMGISKVINNNLDDSYDIFIAELGATKTGDIKEVSYLTCPKIGVITSIGPCHLETFKSIDNIMRTKYELIESLPNDGIAIFNYDNEHVRKLADKTFREKILYGVDNIEDTHIFASDIKVSKEGSTFTLCINDLGTIECKTKLLGKHNISNILAGCSIAKVLGLSLEEMKEGIYKLENVKHRLEIIDPGTGVIVIDDAFNSNPDGAKAALDVLNEFENYRKIIITPGMVELGDIEEIENEKFGENIATVCDIAIIVGIKRSEPIIRGMKKHNFYEDNLYVVNSLDDASEILKTITKANDVILFENDLPDTYNEV